MVSIFFKINGVVMNAFAFSCTIFFFNKLLNHGENKHKIHDLSFEKIHRARDEWNKNNMKQLDFINKIMNQKNEPRTYICKTNKILTSLTSIIRFLPSISSSEKW